MAFIVNCMGGHGLSTRTPTKGGNYDATLAIYFIC